jgi:hypothetical protein
MVKRVALAVHGKSLERSGLFLFKALWIIPLYFYELRRCWAIKHG